jgi:hypothetical protein
MNINWILQRLAVGSSDWLGLLGVIPLWVFCWVWASGLLVIYQCVRILVEEYCEAKQRRREYEQYCRKHDQAATVLVGSEADHGENPSKLVESLHCQSCIEGRVLRARDQCLHLVEKFLRALLEIVLRWRAHRPNENKLSDR